MDLAFIVDGCIEDGFDRRQLEANLPTILMTFAQAGNAGLLSRPIPDEIADALQIFDARTGSSEPRVDAPPPEYKIPDSIKLVVRRGLALDKKYRRGSEMGRLIGRSLAYDDRIPADVLEAIVLDNAALNRDEGWDDIDVLSGDYLDYLMRGGAAMEVWLERTDAERMDKPCGKGFIAKWKNCNITETIESPNEKVYKQRLELSESDLNIILKKNPGAKNGESGIKYKVRIRSKSPSGKGLKKELLQGFVDSGKMAEISFDSYADFWTNGSQLFSRVFRRFPAEELSKESKLKLARLAKEMWPTILGKIEPGTLLVNNPIGGANSPRARIYEKMGFSHLEDGQDWQFATVGENGKLSPFQAYSVRRKAKRDSDDDSDDDLTLWYDALFEDTEFQKDSGGGVEERTDAERMDKPCGAGFIAEEDNCGKAPIKTSSAPLKMHEGVANTEAWKSFKGFPKKFAKDVKLQQSIVEDIERNGRRSPEDLRASVDEYGNTQAIAQISSFSNRTVIEYLATAPWNITKNDKRSMSGAGTHLIAGIIKQAYDQGHVSVSLHSVETAIPFYKKLGFRIKAGQKAYVDMGIGISPEMSLSRKGMEGLLSQVRQDSDLPRLEEAIAEESRIGAINIFPIPPNKNSGGGVEEHTDDDTPIKRAIAWKGYQIGLQYLALDKRFGKTLPLAYGEFLGMITSRDGMNADVYVGSELMSDRVFAIRQNDAETGYFDEMKFVIGVDKNANEVAAIYMEMMTPRHFGGINEIRPEEIPLWTGYGHGLPMRKDAGMEMVKVTGAVIGAKEAIALSTTDSELIQEALTGWKDAAPDSFAEILGADSSLGESERIDFNAGQALAIGAGVAAVAGIAARAIQISKPVLNAAGKPCGKGWISSSYECHSGEGSPNRAIGNELKDIYIRRGGNLLSSLDAYLPRIREIAHRQNEISTEILKTGITPEIAQRYQPEIDALNSEKNVLDAFAEPIYKKLIANATKKEAVKLASKVDLSAYDQDLKAQKQIRNELIDFYRIAGDIPEANIKSISTSVKRSSYYRNGDIYLKSLARTSIFHEAGHGLEADNSGLKAATNAWIQSRKTGDRELLSKLLNNPGYKKELAYPDSFADPYIGRTYNGGETEVISTGMEHLSSYKKFQELHHADREHLALMLGLTKILDN